MQLSFFTWNVKNNRDSDFYTDLAAELLSSKIDILVLQECYADFSAEISDFEEIEDFAREKGSNTLRIFLNIHSKLSFDRATSYVNNKQRCVIIRMPDKTEFNLIGVHLYSLAGRSYTLQLTANRDIGINIEEFVARSTTDKTIIIGDFNQLPFSAALQSPIIFNAVPVKEVVRNNTVSRIAQRDYSLYYNPMWNLLGDFDFTNKKERIAGTYYLDTVDPEEFHWNLLDGVVLSKSIMDNLDLDSLSIVTTINSKSLLHPTPTGSKNSYVLEKYSDHLPIRFTVKTT